MTTSIRQQIITDLKTALATIKPTTVLPDSKVYLSSISTVSEWRDYENEEISITDNELDIKDITNLIQRSAFQEDENTLSILLTFATTTIEKARIFEADLITFIKYNQNFNSKVEKFDYDETPSNIFEHHSLNKMFLYVKNLEVVFKTEIWNPYN